MIIDRTLAICLCIESDYRHFFPDPIGERNATPTYFGRVLAILLYVIDTHR